MQQRKNLVRNDSATIREVIKNNLSLVNWSPTPRLDLQILISHILNKNREFVLSNPQYIIKKSQLNQLNQLFRRRANHEPISYLIEKKSFYKDVFYVNSNVLIPRPETELLVEEALNVITSTNVKKIVEVGTGSGCVILSVAKELKEKENLRFIATDLSRKALKVAKRNQRALFPDTNPVNFLNCNLLDKVPGKVDLLIANLPYIPKEEYQKLEKNVVEYEPKQALIGGEKGTEIIEKLLKQANKKMSRRSTILLEFHYNQRKELSEIIRKILPRNNKVSTIKDYANFDRILKVELA